MREHIGHQLKKHYQACTTEELPPRLLALVKKLDQETPGLIDRAAPEREL